VPFHCSCAIWAFFLLHDQNYEIDVQVVQGMKCVICYNNPLLLELIQSSQSIMRAKKGLLQFNLAHGNSSMKKHLLNEHLEEFAKQNIELRSFESGGKSGRKTCKKWKVVHPLTITGFFGGKGGY